MYTGWEGNGREVQCRNGISAGVVVRQLDIPKGRAHAATSPWRHTAAAIGNALGLPSRQRRGRVILILPSALLFYYIRKCHCQRRKVGTSTFWTRAYHAGHIICGPRAPIKYGGGVDFHWNMVILPNIGKIQNI